MFQCARTAGIWERARYVFYRWPHPIRLVQKLESQRGFTVAESVTALAVTISNMFIMSAPLNGVLYNARTIKWCFI